MYRGVRDVSLAWNVLEQGKVGHHVSDRKVGHHVSDRKAGHISWRVIMSRIRGRRVILSRIRVRRVILSRIRGRRVIMSRIRGRRVIMSRIGETKIEVQVHISYVMEIYRWRLVGVHKLYSFSKQQL